MMRPANAVGVALALLAVAAVGPLVLEQSATSTVPRMRAGDVGVVTHSSAWEGMDFSAAGFEATFAFSHVPHLDPSRDAFVIASPRVGFASDEVARLNAFMVAGGRVLAAVDGPVGKQFLEDLGAGVLVSTERVFTPGFNGSADRVVVVSTGRLPDLPGEAVLSRPVLVLGGTAALVTPELTWRDLNDNGRADLGEPLAPGAVAAVAHVGAGVLIVVGDPDAIGVSSPETAFAFFGEAARGGRVLVFDESHRTRSDPLMLNGILAGSASPAAATGILMLTLAIGAFAVLGPRVASRRPPRRALRGAHRMDPRVLRDVLSELDRQ